MGNNDGSEWIFYQRCALTDGVNVQNRFWDTTDNVIDGNVNILDEIGNSNVNFDATKQHESIVSLVNLLSFMQFDNSAKNMVNDMT